MPQISDIVLKDGQATPANHTFKPRAIVGGVATLVESTGVPLSDKKVTVGASTTSTGRRKVTIKLAVPVVQDTTVNGVTKPALVRSAYADVQFTFDSSSGTQERKDTMAYIASLLGTSLMASIGGDLEYPY